MPLGQEQLFLRVTSVRVVQPPGPAPNPMTAKKNGARVIFWLFSGWKLWLFSGYFLVIFWVETLVVFWVETLAQ